jgi:hypothetical protein
MSYDNLVIVLTVAAGVPFLLAVVPRVPLPGPVLEIVAGVVLGPAVLNVVQPDATVQALSIIGLSFLLFLAGLEIDFQQLRGPRARLVGIGLASTLTLAATVGWMLYIAGLVESPLLIGTALVATSLGLLVPILKDADAVDRPVGQLTIGGLGGYVHTVRELHPGRPLPAVYRADALFADARTQREFLADDAMFLQWLGKGAAALAPSGAAPVEADPDDIPILDDGAAGALPAGAWTGADFDRALAATAPDDPYREKLVAALLSGPMASYAQGVRGEAGAYVPLENGLKVISRHAQSLGYTGVVLFLDELVLWLQAKMGEQDFVRDQVQRLVKLIESADSGRPVPIVSFISRQRDLSQLIGSDVVGADVENLEQQIEYLAERFDVVDLEDSNLIEIIKHRVLSPKPGMEAVRDEPSSWSSRPTTRCARSSSTPRGVPRRRGTTSGSCIRSRPHCSLTAPWPPLGWFLTVSLVGRTGERGHH